MKLKIERKAQKEILHLPIYVQAKLKTVLLSILDTSNIHEIPNITQLVNHTRNHFPNLSSYPYLLYSML